MTFDPHNPDSYPALLTVDEVAAIFRRTPGAVRVAVKRGKFDPKPSQRVGGMLWRRADVLAVVVGPVASALRIARTS